MPISMKKKRTAKARRRRGNAETGLLQFDSMSQVGQARIPPSCQAVIETGVCVSYLIRYIPRTGCKDLGVVL